MAKPQDLKKRFLSKIKKTKTCWFWIGQLGTDGYGKIKINGKTVRSHRASYEIFKGPITNGLWVLHKCDTPKCVNPKHLFLGTVKDNVADSMKKGRWNPYFASPKCNRIWYKKGYKKKVKIKKPGIQPSKLTAEQVKEIKKKYKPLVYTGKMLGKEYGVHRVTISDIITGRTWKNI